MKKAIATCSILIILLSPIYLLGADTIRIKGPDGKISLNLFTSNGSLTYNIKAGSSLVIENSSIGLVLNERNITNEIRFGKSTNYIINETYPWLGNHTMAINRCNGVKVLITAQSRSYTLEARVFNEGVAFRLLVPNKEEISVDETTDFKIPSGSSIWYHDMYMHYEGVHSKKKIDEVIKGEWIAPPGTVKLPDGSYAAITEANLLNYGGFSLQSSGSNVLSLRLPQHQPTSYPYRLRYSADDTARLMRPAKFKSEIITPWRVVITGDLNTLFNSDIVHNLCPPPDPLLFPKGSRTEWIKPGRAVWKYLDGGGDGTVEVMKKFTDGAASLGFEHNILEGFWSKWTDDQILDLVNYSKNKNVSIWFWKHSKSLRDPKSRDSFFKRCHDLGVAGAKIDFFDHEAKEVIDLYESILKEAAKYKLMLDFHGANKPTGLQRTFPNAMVYESVKGMESSRLEDRATHETTIPFTRCLAGPAEYTVMHFGARRANTTWAHQVASAAILNAPLLTYGANPENIISNPTVNFVKAIPAVWDETIVLQGSEIGEIAAFARRKGERWFIAIMNGKKQSSLSLDLSFLGKGIFNAEIIKDEASNPAAVIIEKGSFNAAQKLVLELQSGGGYLAILSK